jgi:hypothetical protein
MQRALRHEVFERLDYGVRHLAGVSSRSTLACSAQVNSATVQSLTQTCSHWGACSKAMATALQGLVAEGGHQDAGVDVHPGGQG